MRRKQMVYQILWLSGDLTAKDSGVWSDWDQKIFSYV